jgi:hypothetical protein
MLPIQSPSMVHLDRMTDSTGMIQHGIYGLPRRESGYTTDDNARALRLCARLWQIDPNPLQLSRVACYLGFVEHARSRVRGFHNFMGYQRDWLDSGGTEDCQGQTILALAEVLVSHLPDGFHALAHELLVDALPTAKELRSLRTLAYLVQAWQTLAKGKSEGLELLEEVARNAADRLVECYARSKRSNWFWFESRLTYANAVLPHALFDAAAVWTDGDYLEVAEATFGFLDLVTTADDLFWPIGNREWFSQGEEKSLYDQQPVEASTMAAAALAAWSVTSEDKYLRVFDRSHRWFMGGNSLGLSLADAQCGACCDGLMANGTNKNQGAESTLAFLWTEVLRGGLSLPPEKNTNTRPPTHQVVTL